MGKVEKVRISGINLYLERVQMVTARTEKCTKNGFMVTNETGILENTSEVAIPKECQREG